MWQDEWKMLSSRIVGLSDSTKIALQGASVVGRDQSGVTNELIEHADRIVDVLENFSKRHGEVLPREATQCLGQFIEYYRYRLTHATLIAGAAGRVPALMSFRAEFEYFLRDSEAVAISLVDRAFVHLQRSLIVDSYLQAEWAKAFREGELDCEARGAVHLLAHGVWAFKASAEGERTDLVLRSPLTDLPNIRRIAQALVLTEWKIVHDPSPSLPSYDGRLELLL